MSATLLVIDGHSLAFRAYYAFPASLTAPDGSPIHCAYGFISLLFQTIDQLNPTHIAIAFDRKEPTHRHQLFPAYKSHRPPAPESLIEQINTLKNLLSELGFQLIEMPGFEADDIMGTLAKLNTQHQGKTYLLTTDQDAFQLVDESVTVVVNKKNEWTYFTPEKIEETLHLLPNQIIDYKALRGDSSDFIPGVPGIGEKTALTLLTEYKSVNHIYEHLGSIKPAGVQAKLESGKDSAFMSKQLATIVCDVPISTDIAALQFTADWAKIIEVFRKMAFRSLEKKYAARLASSGSTPTAPQAQTVAIRSLSTHEEVAAFVQTLQAPTACVMILDKEYPMEASVLEIQFYEGHTLTKILIEPLTQTLSLFDLDSTSPDIAFLMLLKPFFESSDLPKYTHEGKTIAVLLNRYHIALNGVVFDTFLAGSLAFPGTKLSLEALHTACHLPARTQTQPHDVDACLLFELIDPLYEKLKEKDLISVFERIEMPLQWILARMEFTGISLDTPYLEGLAQTYKAQLTILEKKIIEKAGVSFNVNSPKQLSQVLFETLGLPTMKRTKTGPSTDSSVLEKLKDKHPIITEILEFRTLEKLCSTYIFSLPQQVNTATHKIHSHFNQAGAITGRLSSSHPNLQNIPIRSAEGLAIRQAFIPSSKEKWLISADYSQIELRILAYLSQDPAMQKAFKDGLDIHQATASLIFNTPLNEVTKEQRYKAKSINFGILYGMSAFGLSEALQLTRGEAQSIIDAYFNRFPTIQQFINETLEQTRKTSEVRTEFGRIRPIPEINAPNFVQGQFGERTAINTRIQGTAADLIKLAMIDISAQLEQAFTDSTLLLQVHDELVFETTSEEREKLESMIRMRMQQVVQWSVPLTVDLISGKNWKDLSS